MMKKLLTVIICAVSGFTGIVSAQQKKFENFTIDQKKYAQEIKQFLSAKRNDFQNKTIFSDLQSDLAVAINPFGEIHDSSSYRGVPKPLGERVNLDSLAKDKVYTISIAPDSASQKAVIYNNGNTLIYSWKAIVRMYAFGNLMTYRVARLETYIKHKGKWLMVAGSGTEINKKWRPSPAIP